MPWQKRKINSLQENELSVCNYLGRRERVIALGFLSGRRRWWFEQAGGSRKEGVAEEDAAEGVEGVEAVFAGCGDIASDAAEVLEGVEAAEGA